MSKQGDDCRVKVWDTAGQERYKSLVQSFFKTADGVIVTFDLTNHDSFTDVSDWIRTVRQHTSQEVPMVLVGNKLDKTAEERAVEKCDAQLLADTHEMSYYETSAKTGEGLDALMLDIFEKTCEATKRAINKIISENAGKSSPRNNNKDTNHNSVGKMSRSSSINISNKLSMSSERPH